MNKEPVNNPPSNPEPVEPYAELIEEIKEALTKGQNIIDRAVKGFDQRIIELVEASNSLEREVSGTLERSGLETGIRSDVLTAFDQVMREMGFTYESLGTSRYRMLEDELISPVLDFEKKFKGIVETIRNIRQLNYESLNKLDFEVSLGVITREIDRRLPSLSGASDYAELIKEVRDVLVEREKILVGEAEGEGIVDRKVGVVTDLEESNKSLRTALNLLDVMVSGLDVMVSGISKYELQKGELPVPGIRQRVLSAFQKVMGGLEQTPESMGIETFYDLRDTMIKPVLRFEMVLSDVLKRVFETWQGQVSLIGELDDISLGAVVRGIPAKLAVIEKKVITTATADGKSGARTTTPQSPLSRGASRSPGSGNIRPPTKPHRGTLKVAGRTGRPSV